MKVAFHFDEFQLRGDNKTIVAALKAVRTFNKYARTKLLTGTVLFSHAASKTSHEGGHTVERVDRELFAKIIQEWSTPQPLLWHALRPHATEAARDSKVFAICFETIDVTTAEFVDSALNKEFKDIYLGALEVNESLASHLGAYLLYVVGRVDGGQAAVYWDGLDVDSKLSHRVIDDTVEQFSHPLAALGISTNLSCTVITVENRESPFERFKFDGIKTSVSKPFELIVHLTVDI